MTCLKSGQKTLKGGQDRPNKGNQNKPQKRAKIGAREGPKYVHKRGQDMPQNESKIVPNVVTR